MSVKQHYDQHLGNFYSWMLGDFVHLQEQFESFLKEQQVYPASSRIALDLGAGNGIQSVSLAHVGFRVKAIDFNEQLLSELANNSKQAEVEIINADIRQFRKYVADPPEVIICWGDTLTHLASKKEMYEFIRDMAGSLATGGRLLLSFRDYSRELTGDSRFIHVKSDEHRILTCFLEYAPEHIHITDLLYEKNGQHWQQKVSSYNKVRITPEEVAAQISNHGLRIYWQESKNGMVKILALK